MRHLRTLQGYKAEVRMDGGSLWIQYAPKGTGFKDEGFVIMSGAYATAFSGMIPASLWG
jgi:hypothetical protein